MKTKFLLIILFIFQLSAAQFNYERSWGTYLGNISFTLTAQVIDIEGNVYVAGRLNGDFNSSSGINFITPDAFQTTPGSGFVIKLNKQGNVVWGTYINGTVEDMAIDKQNKIVLLGYAQTEMEGATVIASSEAYQSDLDGQGSLYLLKLDTEGNRIWGTYYNIGGSGFINSAAVISLAIDDAGAIYFAHRAGYTTLGTTGTFQPAPNEGNPSAITKFSAGGQKVWSTYYGINGSYTQRLSINSSGIFLQGIVTDCFPYNNPNTYFATPGAYEPTSSGSCRTAYLSKFNFDGQRLWSTYFKYLTSIKATENFVYVTTSYISNSNVATDGTFQQIRDDNSIFFGKFDDIGQPVWGTYVGLDGGNEIQNGADIDVDALGNIYLFGGTNCRSNIATADGFLTVNPTQYYYYHAGFAMKFNTVGHRLWGTYYGGDLETSIRSLHVSGTGFYISGFTRSETNIATAGSLQPNLIEPSTSDLDTGNSFLVRFDTNELSSNENELEKISLFPNPNQGSFRISNLENNSTVAVFDAVGKKLYESPVLNNAEINLKNVSRGIYFVKVKSGGKVYKTEKMIVK